jgi:hypothetical protein
MQSDVVVVYFPLLNLSCSVKTIRGAEYETRTAQDNDANLDLMVMILLPNLGLPMDS